MSNDRDDYRGNPLDFIGTLADVAGGLGEWIANGTPSSGSIPGEIQQRYRDHCDSWSNGPTWVQQIDPGARLFLSNACSPWLSSQGSGDPVSTPAGYIDVAEQFSGQDFPDGLRINLSIAPGPGVCYRGYVVNFVNESQGIINLTLTRCNESTVTTNASNFEIISVGCCAGRSDPPPTADPVIGPNPNPRPDPGLDPEDEPFERRPGQPITPMPRITDPFGDPVQLPNLPLPNPTLREPPELVGGEPAQPGDKGEPDPPTETDPGGEEEETDTERWLMGVLVEVTSSPPRAPGFQTSAGFVYTEAGFVYQGAGDELEYFEESERLLSGGQYFPATRGYDTWRVVANPFYKLRVTPYYKEQE